MKQPLAILFVIPVSYIGVFLTFYWFKLNFDQGGFASFVLLCGITVNASIYILNEYNSVRKRFPRLSPLRAYVKAWNTKVIPIFLTVTSTILGFVPFMVGMAKAVVEAMLKHNSVLLTNHGQVVCGKDFDQVYERATFFEMACRIIIQSGGDYSVLTPADIEDLEIYVLGKKTN